MELIARAVLRDGTRVLLARPTGQGWYFLPGGHVERGEAAADALLRELDEELGVRELQVGELLGVSENRYSDAGGDHHELNLVFEVDATGVAGESREPHIEFRWVERSELHEVEIRPPAVAELVRTGLDGPRLRMLSDGFAR